MSAIFAKLKCECCQRKRERGERICATCTAAGCVFKAGNYKRAKGCPYRTRAKNMHSPGARQPVAR